MGFWTLPDFTSAGLPDIRIWQLSKTRKKQKNQKFLWEFRFWDKGHDFNAKNPYIVRFNQRTLRVPISRVVWVCCWWFLTRILAIDFWLNNWNVEGMVWKENWKRNWKAGKSNWNEQFFCNSRGITANSDGWRTFLTKLEEISCFLPVYKINVVKNSFQTGIIQKGRNNV